MPAAWSVFSSNSSLTLQKPTGPQWQAVLEHEEAAAGAGARKYRRADGEQAFLAAALLQQHARDAIQCFSVVLGSEQLEFVVIDATDAAGVVEAALRHPCDADDHFLQRRSREFGGYTSRASTAETDQHGNPVQAPRHTLIICNAQPGVGPIGLVSSAGMISVSRHAAVAALLLLTAPALAPAEEPAAAVEIGVNQPLNPPATASQRPRIGLVLSGGGARGAAHIGVLKVLDDLGIRVDAVVGTSMGAVVGGLYASGLSGRQIEELMTSVNWPEAFRDRPARAELNFRRKAEDQNFLVRLPLGLRSGDFLLPKALIQGQKLNQLLRRMTLPVARLQNFDQLPIPFRALATDLETGAAVLLGDGDLAQAMRASMSAPGVFAPVEVNGRLLVDGGLSANLPIDAARSLGVDVLIVVDVGFPLQSRGDLQSVATITNQMLAILVRHNSDEQRAKLTPRDVVIDPALGQASSFDFSALARLVQLGQDAALQSSSRLNALTADPAQAADWAALRAAARAVPLPAVQQLELTPAAQRYAEVLHAFFDGFVGQRPDADALGRRVTDVYGQGKLESLDYRFDLTRDKPTLVLDAQRNSWGPNYVRFGLNLQDDFAGNSSFNAAVRFKMSEMNERGGEWIWDLQVGESPRIATEFYQPLDARSRWFVLPRAKFEITNLPLIENQQRIAEYRLHTYEVGFDVGRQFGNWGELRAGVQRDKGFSRVSLGDPALQRSDFDVRQWFARFSIDQLDDVNFPRHGESFTLEWNGERKDLGSSEGADLLKADWLLARSRGRNTGVIWLSGGTNLDSNPQIRTSFPLGGFLNLSGLAPDSISGKHYAIARGLYFRQVGRGGDGFLNVPTYVGLSLELGNIWDNRRDITLGSARRNGSVFLGLDTLLGPVYLGTGFDTEGNTAFYLFLGRTF